jgi:hypothetical protein
MTWGICISTNLLDAEQVDDLLIARDGYDDFNDELIAYVFFSLQIVLLVAAETKALLQGLPAMTEEALRTLDPWSDLDDEDPNDARFLHRPQSLSAALRSLAQGFEDQHPGAKVLWHLAQSKDGFWERGGWWLATSHRNDGLAVGDWSGHISLQLRRLARRVDLVGQYEEGLVRLELHT